MKKFLLFLVMIMTTIPMVFAEQKSYKNGQITAYLSGDRVEIVDNDNNVCIVVSVTQHKSSTGNTLYNLTCGDKYTKNITKKGLKIAIKTTIITVASVLCKGDLNCVAAGYAFSEIADSVASDWYDDICDYFGD